MAPGSFFQPTRGGGPPVIHDPQLAAAWAAKQKKLQASGMPQLRGRIDSEHILANGGFYPASGQTLAKIGGVYWATEAVERRRN